MIVDWLIGILVALAIVSRSTAALVFAGLTAAHSLILGSADGLLYYGSAALTDLAVIMLIAMLPTVSFMALTLQRLSLYLVAIVTLSQGGPTDDLGGDTMGRWRDNLRAVIGAGRGRGQAVEGPL